MSGSGWSRQREEELRARPGPTRPSGSIPSAASGLGDEEPEARARSTPPTKRVNRGSGHRYYLDGEEVPGPTGILSKGYPKDGLIGWAARETAGYAVDHWDELAEVGVAERLRTLEKARFLGRDSAGVRGTAVHKFAHQLAAGEDVEPPEHLAGHVDAYLRFAEDWLPVEQLVETVVGNRRWKYMGTLDLVARLRDGHTWLLDWKTSASGIWPEHALQLAAYRNAEFYLDAKGAEHPMPQVDRVGCVWLRADGYDLIPVDAGPDTFRAFLYVQQVYRYVTEPRERWVGEALQPQEAEQ